MPKKKRYVRDGSVFYMDSLTNTLRQMPKYNAYQCRGGVHGDTKYNRCKEKKSLRALIKHEFGN